MDSNKEAFDEGLNKLVEAAKYNKIVIEYDQISTYFPNVDLTEEIYDNEGSDDHKTNRILNSSLEEVTTFVRCVK